MIETITLDTRKRYIAEAEELAAAHHDRLDAAEQATDGSI